MILSRVTLIGFRNFENCSINLDEKVLIIGPNDVGKTNFIWALRLLLDKGLSDFDREPKDSDFHAYGDINQFEILLYFTQVTDECVISKLKGRISDNDELFIAYKASRDPVTKAKSFIIQIGNSTETMEEIDDRYYIKVLNLKCISSKRDFHQYIKREKNNLFQEAKKNRSDDDVVADNNLQFEIGESLESIDRMIPELTFIASATNSLNSEMEKLSIDNVGQKIVFDATCSDIDSFINNVSIASKARDKSLFIGGDGRLNQIYLCLWSARNMIADENPEEVSIICIEEPEAHLHPHQQRKLAEYLSSLLTGQVLITSHSPQIACEYSPNSIVRLTDRGEGTVAASDGCSEIISEAFEDFGYRLSIIPAEAFFADVVLLVEGPSEELFYKTLSKQINVDLDKLNISVLMVDGIGFEKFVHILSSLGIHWVLRTDNDIFKVPNNETFRMAGLQRIISLFKSAYNNENEVLELIRANEHLFSGFPNADPPQATIEVCELILERLRLFGLYLSEQDLERDLYNSLIREDLSAFYADHEEDEIVKQMQKRKATNMYDFLKSNKACLSKLAESKLAEPLLKCKEIIENLHNAAH